METSFDYNFTHARRGVALIICNGKFVQPTADRPAAELDKQLLFKTCQILGFADHDIHAHSNLTSTGMILAARKGGSVQNSTGNVSVNAAFSILVKNKTIYQNLTNIKQ